MNQCFCRGLAAAVLVSAIGAPLSARAEQVNQLEASLQASEGVEDFSGATEEEVSSSSEPEAQAAELALNPDGVVRVIAHPLDKLQAATLYVSNIPVLTFLGAEAVAASGTGTPEKSATQSDSTDLMNRALEVAAQLDRFHHTGGDPESIAVRWDAEGEEYVINLASERLVAIDKDTILPDTTEDMAEDALQATNRLRRLLGGAAPLEEIAGRPQPKPAQTVAVGSNWDVTTVFTGSASWYGPGFHGRRTASGERFNQNAMTAAHRTLPFGTRIRVTNLRNNRQVIVRVNDRGPYSHGRVLDLSAGAAHAIGLRSAGVGPVRIEVLAN